MKESYKTGRKLSTGEDILINTIWPAFQLIGFIAVSILMVVGFIKLIKFIWFL